MIMKLKGFIITAVAAVVALAACQNKEDLGTPNISLSTAELTFAAEGGEQAVTLEATRDWSVKCHGCAGVAELVDALDLGSSGQAP